MIECKRRNDGRQVDFYDEGEVVSGDKWGVLERRVEDGRLVSK
jgi:hypothetical protein